MNPLTSRENWSIIKTKLKQKYANLTDNDLAYIHGREEEIIHGIQRKTGESREEIEKYLRQECCC